ncbi:MAG TPA: hypothetical protein VJK03_02910 [Candidatus Nanoarchaeia archaeon]|nr:hypothetical protein [Candidatus Nanoarchaeia archaeon]
MEKPIEKTGTIIICSHAEMYGDRTVFERNHAHGFTTVSFGCGTWIVPSRLSLFFPYFFKQLAAPLPQRIVGLWAFHTPEKDIIRTFETPKFNVLGDNVRGEQYERNYTPKEFKKHCERFYIRMEEPRDLAALLASWK